MYKYISKIVLLPFFEIKSRKCNQFAQMKFPGLQLNAWLKKRFSSCDCMLYLCKENIIEISLFNYFPTLSTSSLTIPSQWSPSQLP